MKTFARADQVTRYREARRCIACGIFVQHRQVVEFLRPSGFKCYVWKPSRHRRRDGSQCTHGEGKAEP